MGLRQRQARPKPDEIAAYLLRRYGLSDIRFEKSYKRHGDFVVRGQVHGVEHFNFLSDIVQEMRSA